MSLKSIYLSIQELIQLFKQTRVDTKELLTFQETLIFFGFKEDHLYKLTQARLIPFYKPTGKLIWFKKQEISQWISAARIKPIKEIDDEVNGTEGEAGKNGK
jgi:excisionase family DNA binding protein